MNQKLFSNLIENAMNQLADFGLAEGTLKSYECRAFHPLEKFTCDRGIVVYNKSFMDEMQELYQNQLNEGTISQNTFNWRIRGICIINEIYITDYFKWKVFNKSQKEILPDYYEDIISNLLKTFTCSDKRKHIYETIVRRFSIFLIHHGKTDFSSIDGTLLRNFLIDISADRPKSMDDVVTALRKLLLYLNDNSYTKNHCYIILATPRSRSHKVNPCMNTEELAVLMNCIDRSTADGKRDYAVLMLAATTGLRAGDIATLTLNAIDWHKNEFNLMQGKTDVPLILPLQKKAGIALADYILNARPKAMSDILFLRSYAPYTGFHDGVSISCIFRKYLNQSGVTHKTGDGRTLHGIRRMLGTEMTTEGIPVTTISQVLGQKDMTATKQYISLDVTGLKKCALGFDSIGGATH